MHTNYRKQRPPYGFHFFDPPAAEKLDQLSRRMKDHLNQEGYQAVIPSTLDYPETFQAYESFDSFHLRDSRGEDLFLRSDSTAQVIKGFANLIERTSLNTDTKEHKFYYLLPVFRDVRKSYPHLREVMQLGVETIGFPEERSIPMLVELAHLILRDICAHEHSILLGDIQVFLALQEYFQADFLREVVIQRDAPQLAKAFVAQPGNIWSAETAGKLSRLLLYSQPVDQWKGEWGALKEGATEKQLPLLSELEKAMEPGRTMAGELSKKSIPVRWEPLLARKVDYYTGLIFEGYLEGTARPSLRGGSYDRLVERYRSEGASAAGFAFDISALFV